MAVLPHAARVTEELDRIVGEVKSRYPADVIQIRYSLGEDWAGEPAVFFRALLSDETSYSKHLGKVASRVRSDFWEALVLADLDYTPYLSVRSQREQDQLKDPEWQ